MRDQPRGNELLLALERHLRVSEVGGPLRHGGTPRGDLLDAEASALVLRLGERAWSPRYCAWVHFPNARAGHERVKNYRHEPVESRGQSRPRSQYAGTPATIMRRVTPMLPGSVRSALSTMSAEASRNSTGTNG